MARSQLLACTVAAVLLAALAAPVAAQSCAAYHPILRKYSKCKQCASATRCGTCLEGYSQDSRGACETLCAPGYRWTAKVIWWYFTAAPECTKCPTGTVGAGGSKAVTRCQYCPGNTLPNSVQNGCFCKPGYGGLICNKCTGNMVSLGGTLNACTACQGGFAANSDNTACNVCKPGYGGSSCSKCTGNTASAGGSLAACRACGSGFAPNADRTACSVCLPGRGGAGCKPCTGNTVSAGGEKAVCSPVPEGYMPNADHTAYTAIGTTFSVKQNAVASLHQASYVWTLDSVEAPATTVSTLEGVLTYEYQATRTIKSNGYIVSGSVEIKNTQTVPATVGSIQLTIDYTDPSKQDLVVLLDTTLCSPSRIVAAGATVTCPWTQQLDALSAATTRVLVTPAAPANALPTSNTAAPGNMHGTSDTTKYTGLQQVQVMNLQATAGGSALLDAAAKPSAPFPAATNSAVTPSVTSGTYSRAVYCGAGDTSDSTVTSLIALVDGTGKALADVAAKAVKATVTCKRPLAVTQGPVTTKQYMSYTWSLDSLTAPAESALSLRFGESKSLSYAYQATRNQAVKYMLHGSVIITNPQATGISVAGLTMVIDHADSTPDATIDLKACTTTIAAGATVTCPWQLEVVAPVAATTTAKLLLDSQLTKSGLSVPGAQLVTTPSNVDTTIGDVVLSSGAKQAHVADAAAISGSTVTTGALVKSADLPATEPAAGAASVTSGTYTRTITCGHKAGGNTITSSVKLVDGSGAAVAGAAAKQAVVTVQCAQPASTMNAESMGWYSSQGVHFDDDSDNNYVVGSCEGCIGSSLRNFMAFDVSGSSAGVVAATLRLHTGDIKLNTASVLYQLHAVSTPMATLEATHLGDKSGRDVHADLGDGKLYSSRAFTNEDAGKFVDVPLTLDFVADLNAAISSTANSHMIALGGAAVPSTAGFLFGHSGDYAPQLMLQYA